MSAVRSSCPYCGRDREVPPRAVTVRRCVDTMAAEYRFRCPVCHLVVVKPCEFGALTLLVRAGAQFEQWWWPLEVRERPGADVPQLDVDDLIDLHEALERLPTAHR